MLREDGWGQGVRANFLGRLFLLIEEEAGVSSCGVKHFVLNHLWPHCWRFDPHRTVRGMAAGREAHRGSNYIGVSLGPRTDLDLRPIYPVWARANKLTGIDRALPLVVVKVYTSWCQKITCRLGQSGETAYCSSLRGAWWRRRRRKRGGRRC